MTDFISGKAAVAGGEPGQSQLRRELTKTLRIMKLTAIFLFIAALQVSAKGVAQEKITLSLTNASLDKVFERIEAQTGFVFIYKNETIRDKKVNIQVKNASLVQTLNICLKDQALSYRIVGKSVAIKAEKLNIVATGSGDAPPFIDVRGRVVNEKGEPVEGVTVTVKGGSKKTLTDKNGEFSLATVERDATLMFTHVGMESFEIKVSGKSELFISLKAKISALDELQVIAYGSVSKRLNTGSVATIKGNDIQKQPISNPLAAMQGRVSGLIVTQTSGLPGAAFNVEIRGRTSITPTISNDPLFIIDGVPFAANNNPINQIGSALSSSGLSPFNSINPADIESIEVLKDADATAIYGSRGANGVVLITTKKGHAGKTKLNVNINTGWSKVTRMMDFLNTEQYLEMRKEAFANDGIQPNSTVGSPGYAPDLMLWDTTRYTNIQKLLHGGIARSFDAHASVSGGNTNTQFILGSSYRRETTVFPGDLQYTRGSFHATFNHISPNQKFNVTLKTIYTSDKNNIPSTNVGSYITLLTPNVPDFYDSLGNLNWSEKGVTFDNPLAYLQREYTAQTDNLLSNLLLSYKILPGLSARASLGYNKINVNEISTTPIAAQNPATNPTGSSQFGNSITKSIIIEPQIEYKLAFLSKGKFTALLGSSWQSNEQTGSSIRATGFTDDALLLSATAAPNVTVTLNSNNNNQYRYAAMFGRLNFQWDSKYILNLTARRDGSSRFGSGKQYSNFGSIGAAWIFSNETYFKENLPFLSYGKLRGSYGTSGNDKIGDYMFLDTYNSINNLNYQGGTGMMPTRLYNSDYAWEINKKLEVAIELGIINNRILLGINYYRNRSSNQLINYILPTQTGGAGITANFPATVQNAGFEVEFSTVNIKSSKFEWTTAFNLTLPKNKLVSFPNIETSSYSRLEVGESLSIFGGYRVLGVNPETGVFEFIDKDGNATSKPTTEDRQYNFGNRDPKLYGGFNNSFKYKNLELNIFFEFRNQLGRDFFSSIYSTSLIPGRMFNQPSLVLDRWRKNGDVSEIQRFTSRTNTAAGAAQTAIRLTGVDRYYSDASFIRLKNASISYSFLQLSKKLRIDNIRLYVQGQNLFVLTNYKGSDPESQELTRLPPLKTFVTGIQLNF